jgi:hypothetical protein
MQTQRVHTRHLRNPPVWSLSATSYTGALPPLIAGQISPPNVVIFTLA